MQTPRGQGRIVWASWLKAHRSPGHYRPYFSPIKKKNGVNPQGSGVIRLVFLLFVFFPSPFSSSEGSDRSPHRSGDGRGYHSSVELWFTDLPPGLLCRSRPPLPCRRSFPHRFEQEVGRWSRKKRQACGPLTTSCSLFSVVTKKKLSQGPIHRAGPAPARRRKKPVGLGSGSKSSPDLTSGGSSHAAVNARLHEQFG